MVCFQAAGTDYCMPVGATRAVRPSTGMVALPAARPDVAGIIPGNPPLTVISPLGCGGSHVLIIEAGDKTFGLLVDAVTGLRRVAETCVYRSPDGQERPLISGTVDADGHLLLLTDPRALAGKL
jgi:chemotaxis signal transduction protein